MEPALSSDDSCDSEMKLLKNELTEYGLEEENMSKEEMSDLLKALRNSKSTIKEEEAISPKEEAGVCEVPVRSNMKRRYLNVKDRRMPWCLFPNSISQVEKARTLAVYIKLMSINSYHQARQSANFLAWPPPIQIVEESTRVQPVRSTRSGRSVPIYVGFDDDSSDLDFIVTKTKKRKVSCSDSNASDIVYSNKIVSLKRKPSKDENTRPVKEAKMITDGNIECITANNVKVKKEIFSIIED